MELAYSCAVSLVRYAELIQQDDCAFWGVMTSEQEDDDCRRFWSEFARQDAANALLQAQIMLEDFVRYPLCPQWITGDYEGDGRLVDSRGAICNPLLTRWGMVIRPGSRAQSTLGAGVAVNYNTEPATVTIPGVTISDLSEPCCFYTNLDRRITPSAMTYSGGTLTIRIPRCRLVRPEMLILTGPDVGIDYEDESNFVETIDVFRVYNDPSMQAVFVGWECQAGCTETAQSGCIRIADHRLGIISARPADYVDGAWRSVLACGPWDGLKLNYQAGLKTVNRELENVIVRLAHTLVAQALCACEHFLTLWNQDRYVPEVMTRERLNCPFGPSDGAWFAYQWAKRNKLVRMMPYG